MDPVGIGRLSVENSGVGGFRAIPADQDEGVVRVYENTIPCVTCLYLW